MRLLLIEFNELTPMLLQKFIADGDLPTFKSFFESSATYTTTAGDDPLEPWIQWPSVHCGVPFEQHRALHLGDGPKVSQKALGTVLSDMGVRVGIFGMMNGNYVDLNGYYIPDPWDDTDSVYPKSLNRFFRFISHQVRENTRGGRATPLELLDFVHFMLRNGLSWLTVCAVLRQLLMEVIKPALKWQRAAVLDLLQYDVFRYLNRKLDVQFGSFFSNSTAHLQHYFWRDMSPDGFAEPPSADADRSLREAIRYGYRSMDRLLARIIRDHPGFQLVMCTGLSQEPWYETRKCTYRPLDFERFLRFVGIANSVSVVPVMAERFRLSFGNELDAKAAQESLEKASFRERPLMHSELSGNVLVTGCSVYDPDAIKLEGTVLASSGSASFGELFYQITAMNSGRHSPIGALWIRNGVHSVASEPVSLCAIAPTILELFSVKCPSTMRDDLSLVRNSARA